MLRCIYDDFFLHHPFWRESHVSFKRFYFLPHTLTHGFENGLSLEKKRRSKSHFGAQLLPKISRLVLGAPLRMTLAKIYHFEARFIIYMSREASLRQGEILVKIICQNGFEQPAARCLV